MINVALKKNFEKRLKHVLKQSETSTETCDHKKLSIN